MLELGKLDRILFVLIVLEHSGPAEPHQQIPVS